LADKIVIPIKLKTGSEEQILLSYDMMVGEFAVATNTSRVWKWNGVSHSFIGQCIVDIESNLTLSSGIKGSLYFSEDTQKLFVGNSANNCVPLNID
jgi:hypothetical protein